MVKFSKDSLRQAEEYLLYCKYDREIDKERPLVRGITIDDVSTNDIDDALFIEKDGENWVITISIADAGEAVPVDSPIFKDALERKETRYLPSEHIQMIPSQLSLNALSLFPNVERNTISFMITLSPELNVIDFKPFESRIRSSEKISYKKVGMILSKKDESHPYFQMLVNADFIAKELMKKRRMSGALAFYDLKMGLVTNEEGQIVKLGSNALTSGYIIIQEMMILANSEVSKFFAKADIPFVFRNHTVRRNAPDKEEMMEQIRTSIENVNMLHSLAEKMGLWYNRAQYETVLKGHFGLSLPAYTHVTSPIRRIADLLNHHIIKAYLRAEEPPFTPEKIDAHCADINKYIHEKKDAQAEYFKSKEDEKRLNDLRQSGLDDLMNMAEKEFRRMLKAARDAENIDEKLFRAFNKKIDLGALVAIDIYELIYCSKWSKSKPDFVNKCFAYLNNTPGTYISFLTYLQRDGLIKDSYVDTRPFDGGFFARYVLISNENIRLTTPTSNSSTGKKKAINEAARDITIGFYRDELVEVDADFSIIPKDASNHRPEQPEIVRAPDKSPDNTEYVSAINEIAQKHNRFRIFGHDFRDNFQAGSPDRFTCIFTVKIKADVKKFSATGKNKKEAKANAARLVFDAIHPDGLKDTPEEAAAKEAERKKREPEKKL